jgi:hypothetical protein
VEPAVQVPTMGDVGGQDCPLPGDVTVTVVRPAGGQVVTPVGQTFGGEVMVIVDVGPAAHEVPGPPGLLGAQFSPTVEMLVTVKVLVAEAQLVTPLAMVLPVLPLPPPPPPPPPPPLPPLLVVDP